METVRVGGKYRVVIPKKAREKSGIKMGDELVVIAEEGAVTYWIKPKSYVQYLHGLHKEIWEGVDPEKYVGDLRNEWGEETKRGEPESPIRIQIR